jgi:hypothetical protein
MCKINEVDRKPATEYFLAVKITLIKAMLYL